MIPNVGEVWVHTKTGKRYSIEDMVFNALTDEIDVLYAPLYACKYSRFSRQLTGHPKAFLSVNDAGEQRYMREVTDR